MILEPDIFIGDEYKNDSGVLQAVNRETLAALNDNARISPSDYQTTVDNVNSCPTVQ